jgi:addiction module HigA family antidote
MTIRRENVDAGDVDFRGVVTGKRILPVHPGAILRDDFLKPMGLSVYALAKAINVTRSRVNDIVLGRRAISAETALRFARYFGTTPEFWVNLQSHYGLELERAAKQARIEAEIKPHAA